MPYPTKRTARRRAVFLDALAATQNIGLAAAVAGISRGRLNAWRREDPRFAADWADALETGVDILEGQATRRALEALGRRALMRGLELVQSADARGSRNFPSLLHPTDGDPRTDDEIETRIAQLLRKAGIEETDEPEADAPEGEEGGG